MLVGCSDTPAPTSVAHGTAIAFPSATIVPMTPRPLAISTVRVASPTSPSSGAGSVTPWWSSPTPLPPTKAITPKPPCEFTRSDSGFFVVFTKEDGLQIELTGVNDIFVEKVPAGRDFCFEFPAGKYKLRAWIVGSDPLKTEVTIEQGVRLNPLTICRNPCRKGPDADDHLGTECVCTSTGTVSAGTPNPVDPPSPPPPPPSTPKP
jgi:hypothetical protein